MNVTTARANLGNNVYYVPDTLPIKITREMRPPHSKLTKLMITETVEHGIRCRVVVNHETVLLPELIGVVGDTTIADMRAAYRRDYNRRRLAMAAETAALVALEDSVDIIDDPLPPKPEEPIGG